MYMSNLAATSHKVKHTASQIEPPKSYSGNSSLDSINLK